MTGGLLLFRIVQGGIGSTRRLGAEAPCAYSGNPRPSSPLRSKNWGRSTLAQRPVLCDENAIMGSCRSRRATVASSTKPYKPMNSLAPSHLHVALSAAKIEWPPQPAAIQGSSGGHSGGEAARRAETKKTLDDYGKKVGS